MNKLRTLIIAGLALSTALPAHAISFNSDAEGRRVLMVSIARDGLTPSSRQEIEQALRLGGNIVVDWETAQQCDPNFFDNLVGSVYCDEQRNAKDFDPEKVAPQCMPTTPAVINWLGKHGWTLIQFVPIGDTDAVLTKPWSKID